MEEDSYIVSNFHSICRLCLRKSGVMSPIFDHFVDGEIDVPLYTKIAEFTELQIQPNDGLPARICHRCLFKTEKCVKFRSQCAASEAKLRRLTRKLPSQADYLYQNGEPLSHFKDEPQYIIEDDSVVMVVDPSMDYDSSDRSDAEPEEPEEPEEPAEAESAEAADEDAAEPPDDTFPKKVFLCQYCDRAFTDVARWREHERSEHDARAPWGCEACGLVFAERAGQAAHARAVHACLRPYSCAQCDKAFGRRSDLRKHSVVHTGVRPYRCHFCFKSFSRNTNLSKHLRIHSGQKPHVCPQCPRSFISKGDLSRHALVHSGAKPYTCSMCPLTFGRRDKLVKHEARHNRINDTDVAKESESERHDGRENIVVSLDPYKNLQDHLGHEDLGDDERNLLDYPRVPDHISGESSFAFQAQHIMKEEIESAEEGDSALSDSMLGNGEMDRNQTKVLTKKSKTFQCPECLKKFTSVILYRKHLALHDNTRTFRCKICGKTFSRKRELDRHAVVHTGHKPFECTRCDKKFGRKDKLVRHERIHDEKKQYFCFECPASFSRKDSLMSHIKTHFPDLKDNTDSNVNSDEINDIDEDAID